MPLSNIKAVRRQILKARFRRGLRVRLYPRTVALFFTLVLLKGCANIEREALPESPLHHVAGRFRNSDPNFRRPSSLARLNFLFRRLWTSSITHRSFEAPRVANDGAALRAGVVNPSVTWIGHSTLLIQMDGMPATMHRNTQMLR